MPRPRRLFPSDPRKDVSDEIAAHLEMRRQELAGKGVPAEQAATEAARRFGDVRKVARECVAIDKQWRRETRRIRMWRDLRQDIGYGVRMLGRTPGFTALAVATLALGIGATTAIFSVVDAALLRPLPYPDPHQLVSISVKVDRGVRKADGTWAPGGGSMSLGPSVADITAWRAEGQLFSDIAIWRRVIAPGILEGSEPERISMRLVSEAFLRLHGVRPIAGRDFITDDTHADAPDVALISHAFWQARFGADADVIGTVIRVDREPITIVGVLPPQFYPGEEIWRPYPATGSLARRGSGATVYGRLRPGVSAQQAAARLTQIAVPSQLPIQGAEVSSLLDDTIGEYTSTTNVLMAAVAAILLISCLNVAGLILARGAVRAPEFAVRASVGAGRLRLVRQLLTESLLLGAIGGTAGVFVAWLTVDLLVANLPMDLPPDSPVTLNLRVLVWAAALSLATGLLFGLLPAIKLSRTSVTGVLARAGRREGSGLSRRGGQVLIASEVALALVLLTGAGLMVRSFNRMLAVDLGFDPARVLTMEVVPVEHDDAALKQYYPALVESLGRLPEVEAAGAVDAFPMMGSSTMTFARGNGEQISLHLRSVVGDYFGALDIQMKAGRAPTSEELASGAKVTVLNEQAVKELFGKESAVGRYFNLRSTPVQVLGVIRDLRHRGPRWPPEPEAYLGYGVEDARPATVIVRPRRNAGQLHKQLRDAARSIGPPVVVSSIRQASEHLGEYVLRPRRQTVLLSLLGGLGLLLAVVGVLAMTSYAVARRTQEIGVRIALGARPAQVVRTMLRDAIWPVAIGVVVGLGAATMTTNVIASFLFETQPIEPATFAAVATLVGVIGCAAAWVPARRAASVDPVRALRSE